MADYTITPDYANTVANVTSMLTGIREAYKAHSNRPVAYDNYAAPTDILSLTAELDKDYAATHILNTIKFYADAPDRFFDALDRLMNYFTEENMSDATISVLLNVQAQFQQH
jgi:hypothetical protein